MRRALIVGINHYTNITSLSGCVSDSYELKSVLERNADGTANFVTPRVLTATDKKSCITRATLKASINELFANDAEIALFYFSGHGYIEETGGYICTSECQSGDDGLSLNDVLTISSKSPAKNKIIILDSCHSGIAGDRVGVGGGFAEIVSGMTILTASTGNQSAFETSDEKPGGVFTGLMIDALQGAAANLVGDVTPGSVYAHIDQSLGPWAGQRPVFKTNVESFVSLRKAAAPIPLSDLQSLPDLFPLDGYTLQLDPSFEPERTAGQTHLPEPNPKNVAKFKTLQRLTKVNLVRPVGAEHMWHAAMNSEGCKLTVLGEHYRNLAAEGMI